MISRSARPFVVEALSARLAQIGAVGPWTTVRSHGDPEEALRELMVRHYPRAASMEAPSTRGRVCELLLGIADAARTGDVRYLDAFNVWFERIDSRESWTSDGRWQDVRAVYADVLREATARLALESMEETAGRAPASPTFPVARAAELDRAPRARLRVLVLADDWTAAHRILQEVVAIEELTAHALICNNAAQPLPAFAVRQALSVVAAGPAGIAACLRALWRRRVHFTRGTLRDGSTLQWLRLQQFWVGLHAMGIIYREPVLTAFRRGVLNAHIGLLPEYRGRSVMEWSILAGAPTGVTVFFMDSGIDTGREIVVRRSIDVSETTGSLAAKTSLFRRDGEMYRAALQALLEARPDVEPANEGGRRYYVMSALLTAVVDGILSSGARDGTWETQACMSTA